MDKDTLGKRLFTFAAIADSHLNQDEADCNSPFPVNKLANLRMRHVVHDLNRRDVDFVVHLGDLIHPVPAVRDLYCRAATRFKAQVVELCMPLYLTPGNHDIGDKPMPWSPAGVITEAYVKLWSETFGRHYYSFDHKGVHMVVVNSQLMNSGLPSEADQMNWLVHDLAANEGKRIFLCTHYPPFLCCPDETEHYDNLAEPARGRLLHLMARHRVEGLFAGHVHNFWYLKADGVQHYVLPSTAFVRQDYSEMFKAPPQALDAEAGRNDTPKLGYMLVHVHENGHDCRMVRTWGHCIAADKDDAFLPQTLESPSPRLNRHAALGFDLRQSWAERVSIPPSGALDEFDRKEVRNDYPLPALWDMGIRDLRIPMQDLRNAEVRRRMADLQNLGHRFRLFSFGLPMDQDRSLILSNISLLSGWEVTCRREHMETTARALRNMLQDSPLPLYLGRMWEDEDNRSPDGRYFHVMNHGFTMRDGEEILRLYAQPSLRGMGVVLRIMDHEDIRTATTFSDDLQHSLGTPMSLHLRTSGFNPAEAALDDIRLAQRLSEALFCAAGKGFTVFADTLTDIDRGYFVRHGVLDQTCNPRLSVEVISRLSASLQQGHGLLGPVSEQKVHGRLLCATQGKDSIALYLHTVDNPSGIHALPSTLFPPSHTRGVELGSGMPCTADGIPAKSSGIYFFRVAPQSVDHSAE